MKDFFWKLFEKSGNIDAFMAYKSWIDYERENFSSTDKKD